MLPGCISIEHLCSDELRVLSYRTSSLLFTPLSLTAQLCTEKTRSGFELCSLWRTSYFIKVHQCNSQVEVNLKVGLLEMSCQGSRQQTARINLTFRQPETTKNVHVVINKNKK